MEGRVHLEKMMLFLWLECSECFVTERLKNTCDKCAKRNKHTDGCEFDSSRVCMLPQAGLRVPAVGRLLVSLFYLCLKWKAPVELRPQTEGWAGPPGLSGCRCHALAAFC